MSTENHGTGFIVAAFAANLGIAVAKFVGFFLTRSSSMLAEAVHSVADTGNQGLLLLGKHRGQREADATHQFGYGRERYFWAFVVSVVLFTGGAAFAVFEGISKIRHPHPLESAPIAIGILVVGLVLEGGSLFTAAKAASSARGGRSLVRFIRESRSPELPVVLLEDAAACIGLILALAGVSLSSATGDPIFDGIATLCIGLLLGVVAVTLAIKMKRSLIGESALVEEVDAIRQALVDDPTVVAVIHLRTQHLGPEDLLVAAKLAFGPLLTLTEVALAIDAVEARVRAAVPSVRLIYIEPDLHRSE